MRPIPLSSRPRSRAFSLIELLVVIGILAIVVGLLMPAVQKVRTVAGQMQCSNHLRQVGLGFQTFLGAHGVFPSNGGWDGKQTIMTVDGQPFTPETFDFELNQAFQWGVGDPKLKPQDQTGPWAFSILPHLEQDQAYAQRVWAHAVPVLICPVRRQAIAHTIADEDVWGKYKHGGWAWGKTDYAVNLFTFDNRPTCRAPATISDGLSNTILAGEKAFNPDVQRPDSWYWDEPIFLGGSKGTSRGGFGLLRDGPDIAYHYKENWGSPHPGGVLFLFGDNAVRVVHRLTDEAVFRALLTPDGGEAVTLP